MMSNLRRYLLAGLLVWLPIVVTVLILKFLIDLVDTTLLLLPEAVLPEHLIGFHIPGLGLLLSGLVLLLTGMVMTNLLGRSMVSFWEGVLGKIPFVRTIYSASKQLTETLFSGSGKSFRKVVLVEYPRKGMWSLAFQTGNGADEINDKTGHEVTNVFIPTTPNPTSGFFLMVPRAEVIELDMSIDDGLKMLLSVGVVVPEKKKDKVIDQQARRLS